MKTVQWDPLRLKAVLGLEGKADDRAFRKLGKFISLTELPENSKIRMAGEVENESHVLESGLVGMFHKGDLIRIYFPGDMFLDFDSYRNQIPSRYEFRTLKESAFTVLTFENELRLLNELPEFLSVSELLIAKVRNSDEQWMAFSQMDYENKLHFLESKVPNLRYLFKNKDMGSILGISERTVMRIKRRVGGQSESKEKDVEDLKKALIYPFQHYLHAQAEEIEAQTLSWASLIHYILCSGEEIKVFKKEKLSYLSSFLYPEMEGSRSLWISKLYLWLFYLDDTTDRIAKGQKSTYWDWIAGWYGSFVQGKNPGYLPSRISEMANSFQDLWRELLEMEGLTGPQIELIQNEITDFIAANQWEAQWKDSEELPEIADYLLHKAAFSGAKLAVNLNCLEWMEEFSTDHPAWIKTRELRELSAKMIWITNDLISMFKELAKGDYMNYILLLVQNENWELQSARKFVLEEHQKLLSRFLELDREFRTSFHPDDNQLLHCLKQLKFKVAGSVHWSLNVSSRYDLP